MKEIKNELYWVLDGKLDDQINKDLNKKQQSLLGFRINLLLHAPLTNDLAETAIQISRHL
jgi:hypothetical protein